jgi:hypothetical protein
MIIRVIASPMDVLVSCGIGALPLAVELSDFASSPAQPVLLAILSSIAGAAVGAALLAAHPINNATNINKHKTILGFIAHLPLFDMRLRRNRLSQSSPVFYANVGAVP